MATHTSKVWILSIYLLFGWTMKQAKANKEWLSNCIISIKADHSVHQVVLLTTYNEQNINPKEEDVIRKILSQIPGIEVALQDVTIRNNSRVFPLPETFSAQVSLFIGIQSLKQNTNLLVLEQEINFVTELCGGRRRPKFVIIILKDNKGFSYDTVLRWIWTKQILDASVLEVVEILAKKKNQFFNNQLDAVTLHYYNPYINITTKKNYSSKTVLFPDKLRDMHGYPLKVGYTNTPPSITINRNKTGHLIEVVGTNVLKMKALSKAMNFHLVMPLTIESLGSLSCQKEKNFGVYRSLMNNKIQASAVEFTRIENCISSFEHSKGMKNGKLSLMVPVQFYWSNSLPNTWEIINVIIIINLPIIVWYVSHLLRFSKQNWKLFYIIQIVLGFPVSHEPRNLAERIFFVSILWACFFNVSEIYTAFTDLGLRTKTKLRFETLEEVIDSELQPVIHHNFLTISYEFSKGPIRRLLDKAISTPRPFKDCVKWMIMNKSIACIGREDTIEWTIINNKDNCGRPMFKMVNEFLSSSTTTTALAAGSPYVRRFDDLIQRFIESGIRKKWITSVNESSFSSVNFDSCGAQNLNLVEALKKSLVILCVGYTSGIFVFFGEIIMAQILKEYIFERHSDNLIT